MADFTPNDLASIDIYLKALTSARELNLIEYSASITFELAVRYKNLGDNFQALQYLEEANELAKNTDDLELRTEISKLLLKQ